MKALKVISIIVAVMTGLAALGWLGHHAYMNESGKYTEVYFPNTVINGIDAGGMTPQELKAILSKPVENHVLDVLTHTGTESITAAQMGLKPVFDDSFELLVKAQDPRRWGLHLAFRDTLDFHVSTVYDSTMMAAAISALKCLEMEGQYPEEPSFITDYIPGQGYMIQRGKLGTILDSLKTASLLVEAADLMLGSVDLEAAGVYAPAEVPPDDSLLNLELKKLRDLTAARILYKRDSTELLLDGDVIHTWLLKDRKGRYSYDRKAATAYVREVVCQTFNSAPRSWDFVTHSGDTVRINGGTYGWKVYQNHEVNELMKNIQERVDTVREPVYQYFPLTGDDADFGDFYVEANLTTQHLYLHKDGNIVFESDLVSGKPKPATCTPPGAFSVFYIKEKAILRGADYETPVDFWMAFNSGVGMHDAKWRKKFGGDIFKKNGSHGCLNLPLASADTLFHHVVMGMPVIVYHLGDGEANNAWTIPPAKRMDSSKKSN